MVIRARLSSTGVKAGTQKWRRPLSTPAMIAAVHTKAAKGSIGSDRAAMVTALALSDQLMIAQAPAMARAQTTDRNRARRTITAPAKRSAATGSLACSWT